MFYMSSLPSQIQVALVWKKRFDWFLDARVQNPYREDKKRKIKLNASVPEYFCLKFMFIDEGIFHNIVVWNSTNQTIYKRFLYG